MTSQYDVDVTTGGKDGLFTTIPFTMMQQHQQQQQLFIHLLGVSGEPI
jgi:hypothetical protein